MDSHMTTTMYCYPDIGDGPTCPWAQLVPHSPFVKLHSKCFSQMSSLSVMSIQFVFDVTYRQEVSVYQHGTFTFELTSLLVGQLLFPHSPFLSGLQLLSSLAGPYRLLHPIPFHVPGLSCFFFPWKCWWQSSTALDKWEGGEQGAQLF